MVQWLGLGALSLLGAQVGCLVRELRPQKPHSVARNKQTKALFIIKEKKMR